MRKVKYYYDSENLAYRKIKPLKRRSFAYIALFLLASGLFGLLSFIVLPILIYTWQDLLKGTIKRLKLKEKFIEISKHK
jgi:predicted PurR-regulated permease PerM